MRAFWKIITSLRLTVICLAVGIILVFFGTLAQVDEGLWNAQDRWFHSFLIWWRPQDTANWLLSTPQLAPYFSWLQGEHFFSHWRLPILPGGYLLGFTLLANLVAAHISRFQWTWKKLGIHLTHAGVVILLVGELGKNALSREGVMSFREGETKTFSQSQKETELVFASDFEGKERVISIPGDMLLHQKEISGSQLPCTIRVLRYQPNSDIFSRSVVQEASATLTSALATMEAKYSMPEGLPAMAEEARESSGRAQVFADALEKVGEKDRDLVAATKRVIADPERGKRLSEELKAGFRKSMLGVFVQRAQMPRVDEKGVAAGRLAERVLNGQPITLDSFPVLATEGSGAGAAAIDLPESFEMDKSNVPYVVVELLKDGTSLGTWLLSPALRPDEVPLGGQRYRLAYRFVRYYQPFSVTLLKATHEVYPGTVTSSNPEGIPKNFQSRVRVTNSETGEQREVDIYMNNPLRYGGLTFYQYQMGQDEAAGVVKGTSSLQVVKNPSWVAPYIGCIVVALGMIYQFLFHLVGFIRKRLAPQRQAEAAAKPRPRTPARPVETVS